MDSRPLVSKVPYHYPKVLCIIDPRRLQVSTTWIPYPQLQVSRILSTSLTAKSQLSLGNDFSGIYFGCTTRAHTLTQCTQGGDGGRQVSAGPLSSNLLSQVTDPPKIVKADFTMLSENPRAGRESLTNLPPMENFGRPTILLPGHLDYHLSGAYIGISIHLRCLWDFGNRQIRPLTRTPEQSSRRTTKLSKVSCLGNNLLLLGVVHYFKEWVS